VLQPNKTVNQVRERYGSQEIGYLTQAINGIPRIIVTVTSRANMEVRTEEQEVQEEHFLVQTRLAFMVSLSFFIKI